MLRWIILVAGFVLTTAQHATAQDVTIADDAKFLASVRGSYEGSIEKSANPLPSAASHQFDSLLRAQLWALVKEPDEVAGAGVNGRSMIDIPAAIASYNTIHGQKSLVQGHINNKVMQLAHEVLRISKRIEYISKLSVDYRGMRGDEIYDDLNDLSNVLKQNHEFVVGSAGSQQDYTLSELLWEMKCFSDRYDTNPALSQNSGDPNNRTANILKHNSLVEFFKSAAIGVNEILYRRAELNNKKELTRAEEIEFNNLNLKYNKIVAPVTTDNYNGPINYALEEAWPTKEEFLAARAAATYEIEIEEDMDQKIAIALEQAIPTEFLKDPYSPEVLTETEVESEEAP